MSDDQRQRPAILANVSTWLQLVGLIVLAVEAVLLFAILNSSDKDPMRAWYVPLMLVFFSVIVVGLFIDRYVYRGVHDMNSQDLDRSNLDNMVDTLRQVLPNQKFVPDIIIGISRGGLVYAASLSKRFGNTPVISLWPRPIFDNPLNSITFTREFFETENKSVNILIVDDICRSGRTLRDAKMYVEKHIDKSKFKIETAAISFYDTGYSQPFEPKFFVNRPKKEIEDYYGVKEPIKISSQ